MLVENKLVKLISKYTQLAIVATLLAVLAVLIFNNSNTQASVQGTPYLNQVYNDKVYKDLSAHQHYWWLYSCFQNVDIDKVTEEEVDNWDYFEGSGIKSMLGAMYNPQGSDTTSDRFSRKCSDQNMVKTAFGYLGYDDYSKSREVFCSITGAKYEDGNNEGDKVDCVAGAGNHDWDNGASKDEVLNWYKTNILPNKPALSDPGRYMRSYASFYEGCDIKLTDSPKYDKLGDVPGTDDGASGTKYAVPIIVQEGTEYKIKYILGSGLQGNTRVAIVANSSSSFDRKDCNELAKEARSTVGSYLAVIQRDGAETKSDTTGAGEGTTSEGTSCAIEGVGWIVCPLTTFIGNLNDALFSVIKEFLQIQPSMFSTGSDTYKAWSNIRNLANIAFVVSFLIIIYAQITGMGLSNYGVKKMLPKLIVAAILVNASFWICAIAVDISNIVGNSTYTLLQNSVGGTSSETGYGSPVTSWRDVITWLLGGGAAAFGTVAAVSAIGTYGFFGALSLLLPGALVALLAFISVVVILIARQAFVIILVVVSPLAFVAYLLPNTDQWFQRWRKFFVTLLIMYPSVSLLFGGAELAAAVIRAADPSNAWLVIGSLIVTALPLFALPALMKAAGGLINRIGGIVNNPNRGPLDQMKKGAERYRNQQRGFNMEDNIKRTNNLRGGSGGVLGSTGSRRRRTAAWLSGVGNTNAADAAEKDKYAEAASTAAKRDYVAKRALKDSDYAAGLVGGDAGGVIQVRAYAQQAVEEAKVKDIRAEEVLLKGSGVDKLFKIVTDQNTSSVTRAAALNKIYQTGGDQHIHEALDYVAKNTGQKDMSEIMHYTGEALSKRKPAAMGGTELSSYSEGSWKGNTAGYEDMLLKRIQAGKIGEKEWGSMGTDELLRAAKVIHSAGQNGQLTQLQYNKMRASLDSALTNENIQFSPEQKDVINSLQKLQAPSSSLQNKDFAPPDTIAR